MDLEEHDDGAVSKQDHLYARLPTNARRETIADYLAQCDGIKWQEERIESKDGTNIALCIASAQSASEDTEAIPTRNDVIILYCQGT